MPSKDSHGRPIIVAADWFGKGAAHPRKLGPGEQPPRTEDASVAEYEADLGERKERS